MQILIYKYDKGYDVLEIEKPTSSCLRKAFMKLENHFVNEVINIGFIAWTSYKHNPVMCEAFLCRFITKGSPVTQLQLNLHGLEVRKNKTKHKHSIKN